MEPGQATLTAQKQSEVFNLKSDQGLLQRPQREFLEQAMYPWNISETMYLDVFWTFTVPRDVWKISTNSSRLLLLATGLKAGVSLFDHQHFQHVRYSGSAERSAVEK